MGRCGARGWQINKKLRESLVLAALKENGIV
nr:MAG TPA: hypothetical protein [Caudoviricetes sp.]